MPDYQLDDLLTLMRHLRDPVNGCPWDKKQTCKTIAPHTIEEAYEVADAIQRNDIQDLKLELGDLLFQVVFYAQIGSEKNQYCFQDVISGLIEKLLRRHPHVFPDGTLASFGQATGNIGEAEIKQNWEAIKQSERQEKDDSASILSDVPAALPALARAGKIQKRVAQVGFDWNQVDDVFDKLHEEIAELKTAIKQNDQKAVAEELGDLLFTCTNLARHLNVDAESELNHANRKFIHRFQYIEKALATQRKRVQDVDQENLEALWQQSKQPGLN